MGPGRVGTDDLVGLRWWESDDDGAKNEDCCPDGCVAAAVGLAAALTAALVTVVAADVAVDVDSCGMGSREEDRGRRTGAGSDKGEMTEEDWKR